MPGRIGVGLFKFIEAGVRGRSCLLFEFVELGVEGNSTFDGVARGRRVGNGFVFPL